MCKLLYKLRNTNSIHLGLIFFRKSRFFLFLVSNFLEIFSDFFAFYNRIEVKERVIMLKRIFLLLCVLILSSGFSAEVFAVPALDGTIVKVGISSQDFSEYYFTQTSLSATDSYTLTDKATNKILGSFNADEVVQIDIKNNLFIVTKDGTEIAADIQGPVEIDSQNGFVTVANLKRAGKPAHYRGTIQVTKVPKKDNLFNVINVIDVESYLRGVVPNEMPVRFGMEALKAQAILARNYVLKPREKNYHNYDVCDSVACQVYFGANTENELSDTAIKETENIVAMQNNELILALYSSTAGGYTESYENAFSTDMANGIKMFPGVSKPFLKGVPDNKDTPLLSDEKAARKFYTSEPETFDNNSPYFRWVREWDIKELEDVLKKTLVTQSATGFVKPRLENPDNFGTLKDIKVVKRGVSGKAMSINVITDKNVFNVQKELVIRRTFKKDNKALPSANIVFDFEKIKPDKHDKPGRLVWSNWDDDEQETENKENKKNTTDKTKSGDEAATVTKVVVHGGGYGHGVGMSQFGAGDMNDKGYSYAEIIQHYFADTSITTNPVTLSCPDGRDTAVQVFYTSKKERGKNTKVYLVAENKFQFTTMTVVINGQEFKLELVPQLFKAEKFDITEYLVDGENRITYLLPYSEAHKKPVRLFVELNEAKHD